MRFRLHFKYFAFELYRKHFRIDYFWNLKNKEIKKPQKYQKLIQVPKSCTKSCTKERRENQFSTKSFWNDEGKPFLGTTKSKNSSERFQVSAKKL